MHAHIITDGYTRTGYIAADPYFHDELKFDYRPPRASHRQLFLNRNTAAMAARPDGMHGDPKAVIEVAIDVVLSQAVNLTLVNERGKPVPVVQSGKAVPGARRLISWIEPNLLFRLRDICLGVAPSDKEPEADAVAATSLSLDDLQRSIEEGDGAPYPDQIESEVLMEEADAGNS